MTGRYSQANFIYNRRGSPFSHWLVSKEALGTGKLQLHNKNLKITLQLCTRILKSE